jgi:winged helix-turn-helix DNA-binding protein
MSDLQSKVNRTVQGFVAEVIELVRHTAVETLQVAFADPAAAGPTLVSADRGPAAAPGRRRTPGDLDALARRLAIVIRANPGLRIAELGERLGTPPRRLTVPIRKLIADGTIQARGFRRATTYFAAAASNSPDAERGAALAQDGLGRLIAPIERAATAPGEPAAAPADGGFDAEWYRCLADVFTLAHKLQK